MKFERWTNHCGDSEYVTLERTSPDYKPAQPQSTIREAFYSSSSASHSDMASIGKDKGEESGVTPKILVYSTHDREAVFGGGG